MKLKYLIIYILLFGAAIPALANSEAASKAKPKNEAEQVFMQADNLSYDNKNAIVIANGNVEVVRGERIVIADHIYYYQTQDVVKAKGNVSLLQADGSVLFADDLLLEKEFKAGVVQNFRARFADNSAFAAAEARRIDEDHISLKNAVYSPCKICANDPDDEPLWQLKSDKVMVDNKKQKVSYEDVTLEVEGVPVFYSPYFSHPTPDADRKSGFLKPQHGSNSNLGFSAQYPYYWNISPDKEATITPWFTSKEGWAGLGQYRQLLDDGFVNFSGSITNPAKRNELTGDVIGGNELRGHFFTRGQGSVTEDWKWGFDVNRTTDDTYLRRYRFGFFETLPSRVFLENVDERDYMVAESMTFQRLDGRIAPEQEPFILPNLAAHFESEPIWAGEKFGGSSGGARASFDASSFNLARTTGADVQRLSSAANINMPYVTDNGHVFSAEAGLRTDLYNINNIAQANPSSIRGKSNDGVTARIVPHAALKWRYPLMRQVSDARLTIEPIAKIVSSTNGHNQNSQGTISQGNIALNNEDSLTPEFNSLNLFRSNRYAGLDLIEEGTRTMAGLQTSLALSGGEVITAMAGQELRLDGNNPFPVNNVSSLNGGLKNGGLKKGGRDVSDIVGQLGYSASNANIEALYRLDDQNYLLRRSEVRGQYRYGIASVGLDHVRINDDAVLDNRNDLTAYGGVNIYDGVNLNAFARRDILRDAMVMAGGGFTIDYDCVVLYTNFAKAFTSDRDFKQDTSITVSLGLKNLGN